MIRTHAGDIEVEPVKVLLDEEKLKKTVDKLPKSTFTVLDFIRLFRALYPEEWRGLVRRFGQFGDKRRYTVTTYFSNRLDLYSHRPGSLLKPFTPYSEGKFKHYRKPTKQEQKHFGSPWIAVFKKKRRVRH